MQPPQQNLSDDRLDADAVCEQCDTVNPPGTLFCRTCGENLRDQRMRRLARQDAVPVVESPVQPRRVLAGLLTIFGLLLIIWVAMKVGDGTVEQWLTAQLTEASVSTATPVEPKEFWTGPLAKVFDELSRTLKSRPVTLEEVRSGGKGVADGFDGRYFITMRSAGFMSERNSAPIVGYACVKQEGEELYFVVQFSNNIEVRAQGRVREGILATTAAAVRHGDNIVAAMGYARILEDGTLECQGQTAASNAVYNGIAHRVP